MRGRAQFANCRRRSLYRRGPHRLRRCERNRYGDCTERAEEMSAMDKRVDRSRRDQIIVASGDFPLLATALDELGIHVRHPGRDDTIPELQLTKVELPALAADMVKIRENVYLTRYAESVADASRPRGTLPSEIDDLGLLMFRLRFDFAYRYAGAELVMGLNRYVHSTEAFGEIGGGG